MSEQEKKPFYKKWWVWVIAVLILSAVFISTEDEDPDASNDNSKETTEENNDAQDEDEGESETTTAHTEDQSAENGEGEGEGEGEDADETEDETEEAPEEENEKINAGTYKVSEDIPEGEYLVIADGMAYVENATDSTGDIDSIIFNDNLLSDSHTYVTVNDGEYFKLQSGHMYPVEDAPSIIPDDGIYTSGTYKVGQDIPEGEYKVLVSDSSSMGMGYLEVSKNSRNTIDSIVTNENLQADSYITVEEGQYLKLQDLTIDTN